MPFKLPIPIPFPEIIFAKFRKVLESKAWPRGQCWDWPYCTSAFGYGLISHWDGKRTWNVAVHRVSYCFHAGVLDTNKLFVLHKCDRPSCWNWDHLYLGNATDNNADMDARGRRSPSPFRGPNFADCIRGEKNVNAKLKPSDVAEIRKRYDAGDASAELAKHFGVATSTIRRIARGKAWTSEPLPTLTRTPKGGTSRLTTWDVIAIHESLRAGLRVPELARRFDVSPFTLYQIARGARWKELFPASLGSLKR